MTEYDSAANKTTTYTYDILGRLVSEIGGGSSRYYTYDVAGNRQKAIVDTTTIILYNYDSDGRLIDEISNNGQSGSLITYSYDANGNLISKSVGVVMKTTYSFDVWGNMISGAKGTYTYNAQGLRTSKTVNGETIDFTLVGGNVWSDGTYNYVWGAELITNGSVYYVYNAHGDVIQLLDAEGNLVKTYDYDAYGNELTRDQNDENPFRYCGEYYDTETGFIYLRARYYNPNTGRFISQDTHWNVGNMIYGDNPGENPIPDINAIKQSSNLYAYCINSPINYTDSTGSVITPANVIGALIGAGLGALIGIAIADYFELTGWAKAAVVAGGAALVGVAGWFTGPALVSILQPLVESAIDSGKLLLEQLSAEIMDFLHLGKDLYRAMSVAEYESICQTGQFSADAPNAMPVKWFATNLADAQKWGDWFYGNEEYVILKVNVYAKDILSWIHRDFFDGIGEAFCAEIDQINQSLISFLRMK